jgi:hypothetical protein
MYEIIVYLRLRVTTPIIYLLGLSYLSFTSFTLVEHPHSLRLPWSYFLNSRPKVNIMGVHFVSFTVRHCEL